MKSSRDELIISLLERLTNDIVLAQESSLDHFVELLQIAKLELQSVLHAITDDELCAFTHLLENMLDGKIPAAGSHLSLCTCERQAKG